MSIYMESYEGQKTQPSEADIQKLMMEKAHELFKICDTEEKGFVTKRDMQRLQVELPLSPDMLESVFDSLDDDGNGYLTLEEFTDGFGSCFGLKGSPDTHVEGQEEPATFEEDEDHQEDEHNFKIMMDNLGATSMFDDENTIKSLWCRLRKDDPEMSSNFEEFLYKISTEIRKSKSDFDTLEGALKSKSSAHDDEVRKLYEEMEFQIKQEKERVLAEEKAKERQLREAMEADLYEKDKQLQELMAKHQEMEAQLRKLNAAETETKMENEKLAKEKETLEESLYHSQRHLEESQSYIGQIRQQQKDDKRERARAALKLSEGIAIERESLVKQLDMLRNMNKQLRDDKDEADIRRDPSFGETMESVVQQQINEAETRKQSPKKAELERQGSSLGKYFPTSRVPKVPSSVSQSISEDVRKEDGVDVDDGIECDDDVYIDGPSPQFIHHHVNSFHHHDTRIISSSPNIHNRHGRHDDGSASENEYDIPDSVSQRIISSSPNVHNRHGRHDDGSASENEYDIPDSVSQSHSQRGNTSETLRSYHIGQAAYVTTAAAGFAKPKPSGFSFLPDSPRAQPVGADELTDSGIQAYGEGEASPLQRIFKVVIIGDSGVGKSSFIHRFCHNTFRSSYQATIGVDFQIKSLVLEGQVIVLQLWDTAGQERFRSITKQYYRKADGVIVMYDVTSETTFTNIRNWMTSLQEGTTEEPLTVLLGNKSDLPEEDGSKVVKMKDGSRLADEYGALFYETSALNGDNVMEAMEALARILKDKEDREIEKSFKLEEHSETKSFCCS